MSQSEWNNNSPIEEPGTGGLSEGVGEERLGKFKTSFNGSTLTLVACFLAAIAVLYLLGLQNKPRAASASELAQSAALDTAIKDALHLSNDPKADEDMVKISELAQRLTRMGIEDEALSDWNRNPFEQYVAAAPVQPHTDNGTHIDPPILPPAVDPNVSLAEQEYLGLRLQIVMLGTTPSALINNMVVQKGTHFKFLVVDDIKPGEVTLKYTDKDKKDWPFNLKSEPQLPSKN